MTSLGVGGGVMGFDASHHISPVLAFLTNLFVKKEKVSFPEDTKLFLV